MGEKNILNVDFNAVKVAAVNAIIDGVNGLIQGTNEDIQTWANLLVQESLQAAAEGRADLLQILGDQTLVLAEANRVRVVNAAEATFQRVIQVALGVAARLVIPTIPVLPGI